ncbi:hypothetical protein DOY81_012039 [Sarcophaga bullata]|nr:hypothetical protein DOY81_012039 [Sarcophaga bullata]
MYHWLLLEDYVFNRQTEIDDADDIENKMNSYSSGGGTVSGSKSSMEEIVNDSNAAMQLKTLSTYPSVSDVVGASTSASSGKLNKVTLPIPAIAAAAAAFPQSSNISTTGNRQQQRLIDEKSTTSTAASTSSSSSSSSSNATRTEVTDENDTEIIEKFLEKLNININTELILAKRSKRGTTTATKSSNMMPPPSPSSAQILLLYFTITHKNRSDTLEEYLTTHYDTHLDSMNRFNFALLSHVRDLFNFSFILSKTATWGYLKNGKFDGMIGALVRKQADIGGSPIFFRIERAKVIDYTTRTWVARPCFIFRHPRSTKKDRIVFLQPFTNDVWVFLAICGCITIVLLWILTSIERQFDPEGCDETFGNDDEKLANLLIEDNESVNLNIGGFKSCFLRWGGLFCGQSLDKSKSRRRVGLFFESLLFYLGSICQQGLSFSTRLFSGRCIVITSVLFAFSIYQFYSASIVGTLLMEKPKTIRTLRDLIHSSLEIGIEDIVYNRDYFLRTKDPDAQELYAKKVTSVPMTGDTGFVDAPPDNFALPTQMTELTDAQKAKAYRDILHSHETGAHAKTNEASNWYDPEFGVAKVKKGRFAFHVDVATAYKIIADTFSEKEICDLTEIQLFPPQKMVSIVQKGSPLRKTITYGLRRVTEVGLTDYQRKVWHSPKPRCVKQLHTDDLRVDMQTFTSALLVLIFGYAVSLLILSLEIVHFKLWQRYTTSSSSSASS